MLKICKSYKYTYFWSTNLVNQFYLLPMNFKLFGQIFLLFIIASSTSCSENESTQILVHNLVELNKAVSAAEPGTEIVLANGVWENVEIKFIGDGTKDSPIPQM